MEYCDLNYAAYDIGNHFCEFTGKFSLQLNYYCLKTMRCRYIPLMSPQKNETPFNLNPIANHYPFLFKIYLSFFFILLTNIVIVVVVSLLSLYQFITGPYAIEFKRYPSIEYQKEWINIYLTAYYQYSNSKSDLHYNELQWNRSKEDYINQWIKEINCFALVS